MRHREEVSKVARGASIGVNPECWVDDHGDCLYRYALLRVRRPEVAEDLVQETLCAAVRTYGKFQGKSSERSWLCSILKHKICDYFRKLGRETSFTDLEFLNDEMSQKFIDRAEVWETFRDCLSKLPARVGDVFMLREMEEMETAQICQALRISQNNLWVMLHRARMALRECLELNWFENKPKLRTDG